MFRNKKFFSVFLIIVILFVSFSVSVSAGESYPLLPRNTSIFVRTIGGNNAPLDFSYYDVEDFWLFDARFTNTAIRGGLGYDITTFWVASAQNLLESGAYTWTVDYLSIYPESVFRDLNIDAFINVSVVDENLQTFSGDIRARVDYDYIGEFTTDEYGEYGHYRLTFEVLGVDIYNEAYRLSPSFTTVKVDHFNIVDWTFAHYEVELPTFVSFGFSKNVIFQPISAGDLSASTQREILDKLNEILNIKGDVDYSGSMNGFDDVNGDYGAVEDEILGSVDEDSVGSSVESGGLAWGEFITSFQPTVNFVNQVFSGFLNFDGVNSFVVLALTLSLVGLLLNLGVGIVRYNDRQEARAAAVERANATRSRQVLRRFHRGK